MNRNSAGYEPPMWAVLVVLGGLFVFSLQIPGGEAIPTPFDPDPSPGVPVLVIVAAVVALVAVIVLLVFSGRRGNGGSEGDGGWGGPGPEDDPPGPWDQPPSDFRPERAPAAPVPVRSAVRPLDTGDLFAQWAAHPAPVEPAPAVQPARQQTAASTGHRRGLYDGGRS